MVQYTNKGFEPEFITVKNNTTVGWINASDKLMWVASDPHPSHTNLPGFDERSIEGNSKPAVKISLPFADAHAGQLMYRYTFNIAGKWSYHNHLNPNDRGTVVVE